MAFSYINKLYKTLNSNDPSQKPFEYKLPVKPTQSFAKPEDSFQAPKKKGILDFTPDNWEQYFDKLIYMDDVKTK